jgi:small subunit ribosomal protein S10
VHKKSQENFERITLRRLIQIKDGHPETVNVWLAFLRKYQYFGVGMKANVWEYSGLDVAENMDAEAEDMEKRLEESMKLVGTRVHESQETERLKDELLGQPFKAQWGAEAPMSANQNVPSARERMPSDIVREEGWESRRVPSEWTRSAEEQRDEVSVQGQAGDPKQRS